MVRESPVNEVHPPSFSAFPSTKTSYSREEVLTLLAAARGGDYIALGKGKEETWKTVKSRTIMKKERVTMVLTTGGGRKRKFSSIRWSAPESSEACWICIKSSHFKDECPFIGCRFCKVLGHRIGECPVALARKETTAKKITPTQDTKWVGGQPTPSTESSLGPVRQTPKVKPLVFIPASEAAFWSSNISPVLWALFTLLMVIRH